MKSNNGLIKIGKRFLTLFLVAVLLASFTNSGSGGDEGKFWGTECYTVEHTDALGQRVWETCCTYYVFWISFAQGCSWDS